MDTQTNTSSYDANSLETAQTHLAAIQSQLPARRALTPKQRQALAIVGDKNLAFVSQAVELCVANPARQCIAHTMIGLCHMEKRDAQSAIKHFKRGLYAEQKTDREELGLYFELGAAYELLGDPKEAIYYYEKVKKRDPLFRNVEERIRRLAAPRPVAATEPDDVDAAFDDLVNKE